MEMGFEISDVKFSLQSLDTHPDYATSLTRIFTGFSLIEGTVGGIYGLLRHQDYETALEELKKLGSNARRVAEVRKLIKSELTAAEAQPLDALMKEILLHAEQRNKVAHGIWGTEPGADHLYRLPVKQWINFLASLMPNASDASDIIDELNEHMETWSLDDLAALEREGERLLEAIMAQFNALSRRAAGA